MRCARALPIHPLMPAASSCTPPVATSLLDGLPEKIERPHPFSDPHVGHTPSIIMSPDHCPWTQIRLGAGTRNIGHLPIHRRPQMT